MKKANIAARKTDGIEIARRAVIQSVPQNTLETNPANRAVAGRGFAGDFQTKIKTDHVKYRYNSA